MPRSAPPTIRAPRITEMDRLRDAVCKKLALQALHCTMAEVGGRSPQAAHVEMVGMVRIALVVYKREAAMPGPVLNAIDAALPKVPIRGDLTNEVYKMHLEAWVVSAAAQIHLVLVNVRG